MGRWLVVVAAVVLAGACTARAAEPGTASGPGPSAPPGTDAWAGTDPVTGAFANRIGQFVAQCPFSHRSAADPLVHPHGQVGHDAAHGDPASASPPHSHDFFGNTTTDEHSTIASLASAGTTTCDLVEDLSSYWAPTLLRDGAPVAADSFAAYYDTLPGVDPLAVQPLPAGLSMIAGNDPRPGHDEDRPAGWTCGKSRTIREGVPACGLGAPLTLRVQFPDCWNGRDLDSTDHRGHVAYSRAGACPATHPVPIVRLVLSVRYPVYGDTSALALSSGSLATAHADFMNAWTEQGMHEFVDLCIRRRVICGVA